MTDEKIEDLYVSYVSIKTIFDSEIENIHEQYASEIKELKKQIEELEKVRKEVIKKRIEDYEEVARKIFVDLAYEVFEKTKENRILLYEGRIKEESQYMINQILKIEEPCIDLSIIPDHIGEVRLWLLRGDENIYVNIEYNKPKYVGGYFEVGNREIETIGSLQKFSKYVKSTFRNKIREKRYGSISVYYTEPSIETFIERLYNEMLKL